MRINDLYETSMEEAFKDMSQQATQIGANATANNATAQRQQRITQLAQNQASRNAAPPGRPTVAPVTPPVTPATLGNQNPQGSNTTAPANGNSTTTPTTPGSSTLPGPTPDPTLNAPLPPASPGAQGRGFVGGLANAVGQAGKAIGATAGGVAGIGRAIKKGYNAGANAVGGPGATPMGNTQVGNQPPQTANMGGYGGGNLNTRLSNIERALGLSETNINGKYKLEFESKFLGKKI